MRPIVASALLAAGSAFAQGTDTLDPREYFPLAVGNEWEYEVRLHRPVGPSRPNDESRVEYLRFRIVGDEAGPDADRFALVEERFTEDGALLSRDTAAVRYDAESASVLALVVTTDGTVVEQPAPYFASDLDLVSDNGEKGQWNWDLAYYLDEAEVEYWVPAFVRETSGPVVAKMFSNIGGVYFAAVHGVGFVTGGIWPDGCTMFCDDDSLSLTYAVVGGQSYGAPVVGLEESHLRFDLRPLVMYPNPTSGPLTVEVEPHSYPAMTVAIYDVAGRRVQTVVVPPTGSLVLDLGGLPAGLYVLRAGTQTGRVVIQ